MYTLEEEHEETTFDLDPIGTSNYLSSTLIRWPVLTIYLSVRSLNYISGCMVSWMSSSALQAVEASNAVRWGIITHILCIKRDTGENFRALSLACSLTSFWPSMFTRVCEVHKILESKAFKDICASRDGLSKRKYQPCCLRQGLIRKSLPQALDCPVTSSISTQLQILSTLEAHYRDSFKQDSVDGKPLRIILNNDYAHWHS